jgi:Ca-activated chloride channel family protein
MKFLWPQMLWMLLAAPALVGVYVLLLRRKKKVAIRFASLSLIRPAIGSAARMRRHIPPFLFLLAMIVAMIAIARPAARVTLPSLQQTVILAIDVSLSMGAADVDPNRITAAQAAAKAFVEERPADVRVGLVAFGGNALLVQPPTTNREDLLAAIDRFQLQRGTATGSAMYAALAALLPDAGIDLPSLEFKWDSVRNARDPSQYALPKPAMKQAAPVAPGSYDSGAIILMSDGRRTIGPDPLDAARIVAERGVRVFTVGFGTKAGATVGGDGWSIYVRLDEETLQAIADITKGAYFHAGTAEDLKKVYRDLNGRLVLERKDLELTSIFAAVAAVLLLASGVLSLVWFSSILRSA